MQQLSDFVKAVETRHLSARHLLDIVLNRFAPNDVSVAVSKLLSETIWDMPQLYTAIVTAFHELEDRLHEHPRTVSAIATEVSRATEFRTIRQGQVQTALTSLAEASQGAMTVRDETIQLHVSTAELERRVAALTRMAGEARRVGNFRKGPERPGK